MTDPRPPIALKCPVCNAGFRDASVCSRCGTDLGPLMRVAAAAFHARQRARDALRNGDLRSALRWSASAWGAHRVGPRPISSPQTTATE